MGKPVYEAIVIGGSWGGMDAVIQLIKPLPKLYPIPIIVVIHRKKNVKSSLCDILSKYTVLTVKEVDEKEVISAGTIYIAPANYHVFIEQDKTFSLDVSPDVLYSRPSIDVLFESAALVYKDTLIGIILTGANADGSLGLNKISEKKGLTIVQDPTEAVIDIMPKAAIMKGPVDHVLSLKRIQELLLYVIR
ncbi:MAG: chemotaxis protein CheB [Cytophagales bacterium]|nr:chemotaxis protein CheB [Cytophaga sp.]